MDDATPPDRPEFGAEVTPEPVPTQAPVRPGAGRSLRYAALFGLAALLGTFLFIGGYLAAGSSSGTCAAPSDAFAAFCEAYDKLHAQYVDELDDNQLVEGALEGMFQYGVADPYSGYMNAEEYQNSLGDLSGTFSGIGAELAVENAENPNDLEACAVLSETCLLVVVAPIDGSPAEAAGVQPGDVVREVNRQRVRTVAEFSKAIQGLKAGDRVMLTLQRAGSSLFVAFTIGRG